MPPAARGYASPATWTPQMVAAPNRVNWRAALPGAALAGLSAGIISQIPYLSLFTIFWLMLAGAFAARFYRQRTGSAGGAMEGAKVGAFAGIFAFAITALTTTAGFFLFPDKIREQIHKGAENAVHNADPQSAQVMQDVMKNLQTPEGMMIVLIFFLGLLLLLWLILTAAGGALSGGVSKRNHPV